MSGAVPTWDASMPQAWMNRIVSYTAEIEDITFEGARVLVVERMEERALNAERRGYGSWKMWVTYAKMAMVAEDPNAHV